MSDSDLILNEAKRLYQLGFGTHWLRPNSKIPVKAGWAKGVRDDWPTIEREFKEGYGLGVKLGKASKFSDGYLANIDVDIKSTEPRHSQEAVAALKELFPDLHAPVAQTGMGFRLFIKTPEPMNSVKLRESKEQVKVLLPGTEVNVRQKGKLSEAELKAGWRVRNAWEIEFMSTGKQVVLPPTIHPETKKQYKWEKPIKESNEIPLIEINKLISTVKISKNQDKNLRDFKFEPSGFEVEHLKNPELIEIIKNGNGINDRSAGCFSVTIQLLRMGISDIDILTILTNRDYVLGQTAYDHKNTSSRQLAALWVHQYCIVKARQIVSVGAAFDPGVGERPVLGAEAAKAQFEELAYKGKKLTEGLEEPAPWHKNLKYGGQNGNGALKPILENVLLILRNTFGYSLFKRDEFAKRNLHGVDTPWIAKVEDEFSDQHRILMTEWFIEVWEIQPPKECLYEAVVIIAARNSYHPIKDYLLNLEWDGISRVDTWLKTYMNAHDVNDIYLLHVSRKVLVAMIARVFKPGCKFDYMLILRGAQGLRKSSALATLADPRFFTSTILQAGEKDTILKMQGKWIIEFGELSTLRADVRALKNFMTSNVDRDRMPFNRLAEDFNRECVFIGTTNHDDFLVDDTGNRRFWPVTVGEIDLEGLAENRDQLFAEALFLYDLGEPIYFDKETEKLAFKEQERWTPPEDVMVERVEVAIKANKNKAENEVDYFFEEAFTMGELMKCLPCKDDTATQRRIGSALKILGYKYGPSRKRGGVRKLWVKK